MRYVEAFPLLAASLIASASFPESANAQHALDRLFLDPNNRMPLYKVLSFNNETEAANFFGAASVEASLAAQFFAGYHGSSAHMLFARFPVGGARAHLYGANLSDLTLGQLQAINGSLSVGSQGYDYSASINLSGVASFPAAAARITAALNRRLPVGAVTTESSIAPVTVSFTGSISAAVLNVAAIQSGSIEVGCHDHRARRSAATSCRPNQRGAQRRWSLCYLVYTRARIFGSNYEHDRDLWRFDRRFRELRQGRGRSASYRRDGRRCSRDRNPSQFERRRGRKRLGRQQGPDRGEREHDDDRGAVQGRLPSC